VSSRLQATFERFGDRFDALLRSQPLVPKPKVFLLRLLPAHFRNGPGLAFAVNQSSTLSHFSVKDTPSRGIQLTPAITGPLKLSWLHERHMRIEDEYGRLKRLKV
jgi:hypothetical protein